MMQLGYGSHEGYGVLRTVYFYYEVSARLLFHPYDFGGRCGLVVEGCSGTFSK